MSIIIMAEIQEYRDDYFGKRDIFGVIFSAICYFVDVGSDCYLAYDYFVNKLDLEFVLTLVGIVIPAIAVGIFNYFEYRNLKRFTSNEENLRNLAQLQSEQQSLIENEVVLEFPNLSRGWWAFRIIFALTPFARLCETLVNGRRYMKAKKEKNDSEMRKYFILLHVERRSLVFLRLYESLECALQLSIQLYILARSFDEVDNGFESTYSKFSSASLASVFGHIKQIFSIVTSVLSLAWALTTWRPLMIQLDMKSREIESTWCGKFVLFLAHFFGIAARAFIVGAFASAVTSLYWLLAPAGHIVLFFWSLYGVEIRYKQKEWNNRIRDSPCLQYHCIILLAAVVSTFAYMHNNGRLRHGYYWAGCFVENFIMLVVWWFYPVEKQLTLFNGFVLFGHCLLFIMSVVLFAFFYGCLVVKRPEIAEITQNGDIELPNMRNSGTQQPMSSDS